MEKNKHLYSIGETARMMGISVQMLRNYSNAGLLKPDVIDEVSGYRYYSFQQFHYIDRIRYLRSLGMPLSDIQEILTEGTVDTMQKLLEKQRLRVEEERRRINEMYEDIVWYQSYFSYLQQYDFDKVPYLVKLDKRCILAVDYRSEDDVEAVETRLAALKNSEGLNKMQYRRQFGYLADYDALFEGAFEPKKYFVYVKEQLFDHPNIVELPAGVYLCFRSRICAGEWDSGILKKYMQKYQKPAYVVFWNKIYKKDLTLYLKQSLEYRTSKKETKALKKCGVSFFFYYQYDQGGCKYDETKISSRIYGNCNGGKPDGMWFRKDSDVHHGSGSRDRKYDGDYGER